jgi:hypothetical protein
MGEPQLGGQLGLSWASRFLLRWAIPCWALLMKQTHHEH